MSTTILVALLVCIICGLIYLVLDAAPLRQRVATLCLWFSVAGMLTTLLLVGGHTLKL